MRPHFQSPLAGNPPTTETTGVDGHPEFWIAPRELTPLRARVADHIAQALGVVLFLYCIIVFLDTRGAGLYEALLLAGLFLAGARALLWVTRKALRRRTEIVMTVDTIKVRRWLLWKDYARHLEHRFALLMHDKAEEEQRDLNHKARVAGARGVILKQTPYYALSFHVVLLYAGQRIDLLTVYGQKEAAAIVARLQYCDRALNEAIAMSGGISSRPEDDWNQSPGGIP